MAILKNMSLDTDVMLNLIVVPGESPDWIGYNLSVIVDKDNQRRAVLTLPFEKGLFFDNFAELEVISLCDSINLVADNKKESYCFEPADEKDFCLEIKRKEAFFNVCLFMRYPQLAGSFHFNARSMIGIRIDVNKEQLKAFSNDLRKEYNQLLSELKCLS